MSSSTMNTYDQGELDLEHDQSGFDFALEDLIEDVSPVKMEALLDPKDLKEERKLLAVDEIRDFGDFFLGFSKGLTIRSVVIGFIVAIPQVLFTFSLFVHAGLKGDSGIYSACLLSYLIGQFYNKKVSEILKDSMDFGAAENLVAQTIASAAGIIPYGSGLTGPLLAVDCSVTTAYDVPQPQQCAELNTASLSGFTLLYVFLGSFVAPPIYELLVIDANLPFPDAQALSKFTSMLYEKQNGGGQSFRYAKAFWRTFSLSAIFELFSYLYGLLQEFPIFGLTASEVYQWKLNIAPDEIATGLLVPFTLIAWQMIGCLVGWGIIGPLVFTDVATYDSDFGKSVRNVGICLVFVDGTYLTIRLLILRLIKRWRHKSKVIEKENGSTSNSNSDSSSSSSSNSRRNNSNTNNNSSRRNHNVHGNFNAQNNTTSSNININRASHQHLPQQLPLPPVPTLKQQLEPVKPIIWMSCLIVNAAIFIGFAPLVFQNSDEEGAHISTLEAFFTMLMVPIVSVSLVYAYGLTNTIAGSIGGIFGVLVIQSIFQVDTHNVSNCLVIASVLMCSAASAATLVTNLKCATLLGGIKLQVIWLSHLIGTLIGWGFSLLLSQFLFQNSSVSTSFDLAFGISIRNSLLAIQDRAFLESSLVIIFLVACVLMNVLRDVLTIVMEPKNSQTWVKVRKWWPSWIAFGLGMFYSPSFQMQLLAGGIIKIVWKMNDAYGYSKSYALVVTAMISAVSIFGLVNSLIAYIPGVPFVKTTYVAPS